MSPDIPGSDRFTLRGDLFATFRGTPAAPPRFDMPVLFPIRGAGAAITFVSFRALSCPFQPFRVGPCGIVPFHTDFSISVPSPVSPTVGR